MTKCIVKGCRNTSRKNKRDLGVTLHGFPCSIERIKLWLQQIGQDFGNLDSYAQKILDTRKRNIFRICSAHFEPENYICQGMKLVLRADAVPTIFPASNCRTDRKEDIVVPPPKKLKRKADTVQTSLDNMNLSGTNQTNEEEEAITYAIRKYMLENTLKPMPKEMVDASTSTDPKYFNTDQGVQWSEDEFNCTKQPLMIKHDPPTTNIFCTPLAPKEEPGWDPAYKEGISNTGGTILLPLHKVHTQVDGCLNCAMSQHTSSTENITFTAPKVIKLESDSESSPITRTKSFIKRDVSEAAMAHERKFIVFESCLDDLFLKLSCGSGNGCRACITGLEKYVDGSFLTVIGHCHNGHRFHLWHSQPVNGQVAVGNLLMAAALLFSGSSFPKVKEMNKLLGLQQISAETYYDYQQKYLFPTVDVHWHQERQLLRDAYISSPLSLAGDCQKNIPGHSTEYCSYTLLDVATKRILDFQIEQMSERTPPIAGEKLAFKTCLNRILDEQFDVKAVATDCDPGIKKIMRKKYGYLKHEYDVWLYARILKQRLKYLSKRKACPELEKWIPTITSHLWWAANTSHGNTDLLLERWQSLLPHLVNQHKWKGMKFSSGCTHRPLAAREQKSCPWLKKGTLAFYSLRQVIIHPHVSNDLLHLSQISHAEEVEMYHRFVLKYRPKCMHLKMDAIEAMTKLAVLAYNANIHRQKLRCFSVKKGKGVFGTVTHVRKCRLAKPLYHEASSEHVIPMMTDVIKISSGKLCHSWFPRVTTALRP
ncbi:hypothetical protein XENTR_v10021182 [Xenopus tropicalis]|uniref:Uncharacterized LOC100492368 n=1 Tax=Xenopus tropicalis TaxID=8364 RepID=A0A6I8RX68_XENTR|nr:uncharacterized protein LOC100492368 [Xenopus tropicalis]XP_031747397.1 uncharacterized protein LOC100492368 [Xenopus tropicalis]KAE8584981.1 hypothetical protein XENTR_v10021182 [Xenopus tropicalis]